MHKKSFLPLGPLGALRSAAHHLCVFWCTASLATHRAALFRNGTQVLHAHSPCQRMLRWNLQTMANFHTNRMRSRRQGAERSLGLSSGCTKRKYAENERISESQLRISNFCSPGGLSAYSLGEESTHSSSPQKICADLSHRVFMAGSAQKPPVLEKLRPARQVVLSCASS